MIRHIVLLLHCIALFLPLNILLLLGKLQLLALPLFILLLFVQPLLLTHLDHSSSAAAHDATGTTTTTDHKREKNLKVKVIIEMTSSQDKLPS